MVIVARARVSTAECEVSKRLMPTGDRPNQPLPRDKYPDYTSSRVVSTYSSAGTPLPLAVRTRG